MQSLNKIFGLLIVAAAVISPAMAQQNSSPPTQLALEIHYFPKQPPTYQSVSAARHGSWFARFGQVPGWKQPPDSLPVTAVNVKWELAEDGVRVWVSVFLGELHQQESKISSYVMHEGEKVTVQELAQVGVEPFQIKLVRINPSIAEMPQFTSKAKSIEVVVMQPNISTLPTYQVVVRNVSGKNVVALAANVILEGRPRIMSLPRGKEGEPIIAPAGTYEFTVRLATQATPMPDGYTPTLVPNQVIEVSSVIFDDGSFEGNPEQAIHYAAFQKGDKMQLARVVDLFARSLNTTDAAASATLASLKAQVAALNFEPDAASVEEVHSKFPDMSSQLERDLKPGIEISMKELRDGVVKDIVEFQLHHRQVDPNTLREWLTSSKQRYEAWLARL